jgi:hypothetical protein
LQQWTTASGGNGHYYEAVSQATAISWTNASNAATAAGGYLATITSSAENDFVANSVINSQAFWFQSANNHGPWIGGFQPAGSTEPAGGWTWVDQTGAATAEPFTFTNWAAGQPSNDSGIEDSLNYFKSGTGLSNTWNDEANSNTFVRSFVIEFNSNPAPEPSGIAVVGIASVFTLGRRVRQSRACI